MSLKQVMPRWETNIEVWGRKGMHSTPIKFDRGLDSLSPLLFCLAVAPLSSMLRQAGGFKSQYQPRPITHLMYMDDLKVYETDPEELEATAVRVESTSNAFGMQLGADKCRVAHLKRGRVVERGGVANNQQYR